MREWGEGRRPELSSLEAQSFDRDIRGSLRFSINSPGIRLALAGAFAILLIGAAYSWGFYDPNRNSDLSRINKEPTILSVGETPIPAKEAQPYRYEFRAILPNGRILLFRTNEEPLKDGQENINGLRSATCEEANDSFAQGEALRDYGCYPGEHSYFFRGNVNVIGVDLTTTLKSLKRDN